MRKPEGLTTPDPPDPRPVIALIENELRRIGRHDLADQLEAILPPQQSAQEDEDHARNGNTE